MKANTSTNGNGSPTAGIEDLELRVFIAAKPQTVFQFFSDPQRYRKWMGTESSIDPMRGGALTVRHGPGPLAVGKIVEWVENEKLGFTWGHRAGDAGAIVPDGSTTVTINLEPKDDGTLVILRHAGLPTEAQRQGHCLGWRYYLARLSAVSWAERMDGKCESLVDAFFNAWNEAHPAKRNALLHRCVSTAVQHRDPFACIDGSATLHDHIGGVITMMQGARIDRSGPVEQTHDYLRCPWKVTLPDGGTMATGVNVFELDADGLIRSCVGFWDASPAT